MAMAPHSDLAADSSCFNASCPDGWVDSLSPAEIGFLQLYDDQWLDLGREKVMSVLKAAYALVDDVIHGPQIAGMANGTTHSGYRR
jgi:hypothetical protein